MDRERTKRQTERVHSAAQAAEQSLHEFVKQAWPVVDPAHKFIDNWHIAAICDHLSAVTRGEITRLLINVPYRSSKSTIVAVMWPAWTWTQNPSFQWLTGSHGLDLAIRDNLAMRRLVTSSWYQDAWGDKFALTGDQNQKTRFENDQRGYRLAFGMTTGVMGQGGDGIVVDDPHDREGSDSDAERETTLLNFDLGIATRLNDPAKSSIVIIMQRLNAADLSGHVLESGEGYEHVVIPMHYDPSRSKVTVLGWSDPRTRAGELMWPARFTDEWCAREAKRLGPYGASGQLEQNPSPSEGGIFKREDWRFYDTLPAKFDASAQSWDLAFKGTKTSNYVAGQAWGRVGANVYWKPGEVYDQLDFVQSLSEFVKFSVLHPDPTKLVEDKANGPALIATLKDKIPGITPVNPDGGSEAVARSCAPYVAAGNVWLPNPWTAKPDSDGRIPLVNRTTVREGFEYVVRFVENCATFPTGSIPIGSHGDDVVAATQAIHHMLHDIADSQFEGMRLINEAATNARQQMRATGDALVSGKQQGPQISSVAPSVVFARGGDRCVIVGANLIGAAVEVDGVAVPCMVLDRQRVEFITPMHSIGSASVVVRTSSEASATTAISYVAETNGT